MSSPDYYEDLKIGNIRDLGKIIDLNAYWRDVRLAYDASGNVVYRGVTYFHGQDAAVAKWEIWKYTHGDDGVTRIEGPLPGAWDDRATLSWG